MREGKKRKWTLRGFFRWKIPKLLFFREDCRNVSHKRSALMLKFGPPLSCSSLFSFSFFLYLCIFFLPTTRKTIKSRIDLYVYIQKQETTTFALWQIKGAHRVFFPYCPSTNSNTAEFTMLHRDFHVVYVFDRAANLRPLSEESVHP